MKASLQLVLLVALVSIPFTRSAAAHDTSETAQALRDFHGSLVQMELEAERLESFSHSAVTWHSHADQLNHLSDHVNELGQILNDLERLRPQANASHSQAITDARRPLERLAANVTAAVNLLRDDRFATKTPEYRALTDTIWTDADALHSAIERVSE